MFSEPVKCIIVDDEPKAIELLARRLSVLFPHTQVIATFTDWEKALVPLRAGGVDLLFLDISMPGKNGIDFVKLFGKVGFEIIFVTAHSEYAVDAIKLSAAGYILKPVDDVELSFAVNKVLEKLQARKQVGGAGMQGQQGAGGVPGPAAIKIGIPTSKGIDYINAHEILYFESINKYTKVVTKAFSVLSSYYLASFKNLLDQGMFFQVHRSFIVNLQRVRRFELPGTLIMEDDRDIPVSKSARAEFNQLFSRFSRIAGSKKEDNGGG